MKSLSRRFFRMSIFLLLTMICVYFFLHSSFFQVNAIKVTGNLTVAPQEILAMAGIESGTNLFAANEKLVSQAVELHPMIKQARLVRHLPQTLEIQVTERVMWAVVPVTDEFLVVDAEGVCIDKALRLPSTGVPVITIEPFPRQVILGQPLESQGIALTSKVWEGLSQRERDAISDFHYNADSKELIIYTAEGTEIRFGTDERLDEKLSAISQIFQLEQDFTESGKEALVYVDIRYKGQPVVKTRF